MELNQYIDHTLLKSSATPEDIIALCQEAKTYNFYSVCVNGCYVPLAKDNLNDSKVKIVAVIGFPLGASTPESKIREAEIAVEYGADEIDMVINVGFLKGEWYEAVTTEITEVKKAIGSCILKVILETCYLSEEEIRKACKIAIKANADFVKTSTGFGTGGATEKAVEIMREEVGNIIKIKASGGIRDLETANKFIEMGVSRIGTSSGVAIVSDLKNRDTNEHTY
jgi:deoxyribose-phosphate aldolase